MTDTLSLEQKPTAAPASPASVLRHRNFRTLDINTGISMLGLGLAALALANFQE
jgi:hypothetical protein